MSQLYGALDYLAWLNVCSLSQSSLPSVFKVHLTCTHGFGCWLFGWNFGNHTALFLLQGIGLCLAIRPGSMYRMGTEESGEGDKSKNTSLLALLDLCLGRMQNGKRMQVLLLQHLALLAL